MSYMILCLGLVLSSIFLGRVDDPTAMYNAIAESVKIDYPKWTLIFRDQKDQNRVDLKWDGDGASIHVMVEAQTSESMAAKTMRMGVRAAGILPSAGPKDLGEESVVWKGENGAVSTVYFRRLRFLVNVSAPSPELAAKVAKSVDAAIKRHR